RTRLSFRWSRCSLFPLTFLQCSSFLNCLLWLNSNSVAQPVRGGHPEVVPLKVQPQNIVMRGSRVHGNARDGALRVADRHFRRVRSVRSHRRTVNRPVRTIIICEALVGGEPGTGAVQGLHLVQEIAGESAVFFEEVLPVAPVVAASAEISGDP